MGGCKPFYFRSMVDGGIAKKRRRRRKKNKQPDVSVPFYATIPSKDLEQRSTEDLGEDVQVEYVVESDISGIDKPEFSAYANILRKFNPFDTDEDETEKEDTQENQDENQTDKLDDDPTPKKTKKKDKRNKIEVLKLLSDHPEIVEIHDANSPYPWLLVDLKSYRNTVPVPRHWCQRRKYLQGKRGIEKPPFELPDFIRATGICDIRQAVLEKEESSKLKQQARERLQPKTGKIDIDYHVLYDAFFRNQTKPALSGHSDLYYEGKEYEVNLKERKPGHLSKKLRAALGMPEEGIYPPPWLINMQRVGPPPAYPHLRIPGLNAPLPPGAKTGFHPGGWGQPPVDSAGRPLYGGDWSANNAPPSGSSEPIESTPWGLFEDNDESDDEQYDTTMDEAQEDGYYEAPTATLTSAEMNSGTESVSGYETPESIDLRKQKLEKESMTNNQPKQLYQELKTEQSSVGGSMFGSQHRYVMPSEERVTLTGSQRVEKMEVSLNPNEIDEGITEDLIRKKYDDTLQLEKAAHRKEDMSDIIAKETAKRKKKEKKSKKDFRF